MLYRSLLFFLLLLLMGVPSSAQGPLVRHVLKLINEARETPREFLEAHRTEIERYQPRYVAILKAAAPLPPVVWDPGLEAMARERVENDNLNPVYGGGNTLCGTSNGWRSSTYSGTAMEYVCDVYTNINDPDYQYLGVYYNEAKDNSYVYFWGITCERKSLQFSVEKTIDSSRVDFQLLNLAAEADYMAEYEQRMVVEINFVRHYPRVYARIVEQYLADESQSGWGLRRDTYLAGKELIAELDTMQPRSILQPRRCVFEAAKRHGADCRQRGFFDHAGSDESMPWDRVLVACPELTTGNENGAGGADGPREVVIRLLLDAGISSRGHRYNLLNPQWQYVACYRYEDPVYTFQWVQKFGY